MTLNLPTLHCTSQAHCGICRDLERGKAFRDGLRRLHAEPCGDECEWHPWGYVPPERPAASQPQQPDIPVEALTDEERVGLGDLLATGIKAVGLDVLARWYENLTGQPCGCETRRSLLNRLASWRKSRPS